MDSSAVSKRNTDGLKAFAQKKKASTLQKVNDAIQRLIKDKAKINFNSVSMESVVTKTYIYNNQELRDRIETLRKQQEGLPSPKQIKREMTDASKDILIASKNKRIKEQVNEIKKLKEELAYLRGKIYDSC
ncbi:MAG: succinate dehydrogenase/fumarate reductase flavoprotein subunit [Clostridium sp.]|jgi:succinate dehydrogenase/fumarate reductase flavoprotein subunit